ncbi:MAG TPA: NAD(P)H-dependent oxidoreductase [Burkholderiales bacterium]|nr:NAD(P)H-dependent oxidoreductase [Burkholderiales bacterium]
MSRRIAILQGHPDRSGRRFGHALARSYEQGAGSAAHEVRIVQIARLDFPLLRTQEDWRKSTPPGGLADAQDAIRWAEHLVLFFPLWLGTMPALVKGFLEQALRPGFALGLEGGWKPLLRGRSARVVVTMGMPSLVYRTLFGSHGVRGLEQGILRVCGIRPVRSTLIGDVEGCGAEKRRIWLEKLAILGQSAL